MKDYLYSCFSLVLLAALPAVSVSAQVTTDPVGYSTWTIAAGSGASQTITTLGLPLYVPASTIVGASSGIITGVTSNTLTVSGAGWNAGALSQPATPYCVRITSGAAEGRNLLISTTPNSGDVLTIDTLTSGVADLSELGILSATDTFEIIVCDTLLSLFGQPVEGGLVGGASSAAADVVYLFLNSSWKQFYYNTDTNRWTKIALGSPDASNQVLMPDAGILFARMAAISSEFVLSGTVPMTARSFTINAAGLTPLGNAWPVDISLADTNLEATPNWVSSSNSSVADIVYVMDVSWKIYYHDGSNWRKKGLGAPISDDVVIKAGSAVMVSKTSSATTVTSTQALPYSL